MVASQLQDILRSDLSEDNVRVVVQTLFDQHFTQGFSKGDLSRSKVPNPAKSLREFYTLVKNAITNYETRQGVVSQNAITFTEEEPDIKSQTESIVYTLIGREPGAYGKGAPTQASVRNQRPIIREITDDRETPGYRKIITGYFYDNVVRFTCWARTNKTANKRAEWFEDLMEDYSWWFKLQGVDRVIFLKQQQNKVVVVNDNKWYGRPVDFFVRTEKLRVYSEKELQEILVQFSLDTESN